MGLFDHIKVDPDDLNKDSPPSGLNPAVDGGRTPALDAVLDRGWAAEIGLTGEQRPGPMFCSDGCAFVGRSLDPYDHIRNDVTEAYYPCALLRQVVWAEGPPCTAGDWEARARREVEKLEEEAARGRDSAGS